MNIHSVTTAAAADKRTAILDAATATFAKHGFFGAQVADIAKAAGIAAGTVYLYFRSPRTRSSPPSSTAPCARRSRRAARR
jgi:AcrR family transcriptional regulator